MPKIVPQRMCTACREMKDKKDLFRIVKNKEDKIFIDTTFKANGRGAYLCKTEDCLNKAIKTKSLNRAFKCEVPASVYDTLRDNLSK